MIIISNGDLSVNTEWLAERHLTGGQQGQSIQCQWTRIHLESACQRRRCRDTGCFSSSKTAKHKHSFHFGLMLSFIGSFTWQLLLNAASNFVWFFLCFFLFNCFLFFLLALVFCYNLHVRNKVFKLNQIKSKQFVRGNRKKYWTHWQKAIKQCLRFHDTSFDYDWTTGIKVNTLVRLKSE